MHIYDLDTPAVVIDIDVLERNIQQMAAHCKGLGITLRGHTKSHKNPAIARMQVASGSRGIVCQKLGDAEVMAKAGLDDILMTYNIVGRQKVRRLTELARWRKMTVTADSEDVVRGISDQARIDGVRVGVLVEMDTGGKRTGVQSPEAAAQLGQLVMGLPGLELRGLMTYPSLTSGKAFMDAAVEKFHELGLPTSIISGGGTGHEAISKQLGCTEHRSGSYVYEGLSRISRNEDLDPQRCPLRVVTTVVSVPTRDRVIIDGGMKTFRLFPTYPYGKIIEEPDASIYGMSVEHGHVDVSKCSRKFKVGDRLTVIPLYQEGVTNLHEEITGFRKGEVELVWRVEGRGKVR